MRIFQAYSDSHAIIRDTLFIISYIQISNGFFNTLIEATSSDFFASNIPHSKK